MQTWLQDEIDGALARVAQIAHQRVDFPHITAGHEWQNTPDGVWTGGFWAGLLWLAYEQTQREDLRLQALHFTDRLLPRALDTRNHDLGFMFFPSAIKGWSMTGEARYRAGAITAAHSLAGQFNGTGGFIPGWGFFGASGWGGQVLIDTLMNLPLMVWAVQQGADEKLMDVVHRHAATSLRYLLREDGSVFHMFRFEPASGAPIGGDTYQGLGPDSAWARGQAWALTGLAILAGMTGASSYRDASERVATYFQSQVAPDGVPAWDFQAQGSNQPKDSSAAAIASYGYQKLYAVTGQRRHLDSAERLLKALSRTCANRAAHGGGLLLHATADLPHGLGIDESTMYGDYYYLKSLLALKARHADA